MKTFLIRRLLSVIPLLLAVSFLTYLLLDLAPGDYVTKLEENPAISQQQIIALRKDFGLDGNVFQRYGHWLQNAVRGNMGYSFENRMPVFDLVMQRLGNTLLLALSSLIFAWGFGLPLGMLAAVKRNQLGDKIAGILSFVGISVPELFFALVMVMFAAKTGIFPTGGLHDEVNWDDFTPGQKFSDAFHHLLLPTIVLGTTGLAQIMRQMRSSMTETLSQDYIRTAKAKGLVPRQVLFGHAFGNAINPLITLFGFSLAHLLNGAFLVEIILSWPGMARLTVSSMFAQDEPVVMASIVMSAVMLIVGNLISDILLAAADPRIRLE